MRRYALGRKDGGVTVLTVFAKDETAKTILAKWPDYMRDAITEIVEIQQSDIPADTTNRENWRLENGRIVT